ncbi:MAG: RecB family exonuclease, partial [Solirubrobacterales bacterium]
AVTRAQQKLILTGQVSPTAVAKQDPARSISVAERLVRNWEIPLGGEDGLELEGDQEGDQGSPVADLLEIPVPPGRLTVSMARPTADWAQSVRRTGRAAGEPHGRAIEAPLVREAPGPALVRPSRLSYTSIAQYEECGFRFYAERVLGLPEDSGRPGAGGSAEARARGSAVHALLEWSARHQWQSPDRARVEAALLQHGLEAGEAQAEELEAVIGRWAESDLRGEIERDCDLVRAEVDFALTAGRGGSGAVIGGQIDLLGRRAGGAPLVVDYKTNRLDGREPRMLLEAKYSAQRDIYALAASAGAERAETAFVFLERPDQPVRDEFGPLQLAAARERLDEAVSRIAEDEFSATHEPSEALCSGCPAKAGLCPRWEWREGKLVIADAVAA